MSSQNEDELICDESRVRSSQVSWVGAGLLKKLRCDKVGICTSFHSQLRNLEERQPQHNEEFQDLF